MAEEKKENSASIKKIIPGFLGKFDTKILALAVLGAGALIAAAIFYAGSNSDKTPPELYMSSPSSDEWYSTDDDNVTLEGYVMDANGIKSVIWETSGGKKGNANVTSGTWSAANIPLVPGDNDITITVIDKGGNTTDIIYHVVYNADIEFSDLSLNKNTLFKDDPDEEFTVRSSVLSKHNITDVSLYRIQGNDKNNVTQMLDNGVVANGDDIPGDNVFSGINAFSSNTLDEIILRVGATLEGSTDVYLSGVLKIDVLDRPADALIMDIFTLNNEINAKYEELKQSNSPKGAANKLASYLNNKTEDIEKAGVSENGTGVWWKFKKTGILGGVSYEADDKKGSEDAKRNYKDKKVSLANYTSFLGGNEANAAAVPADLEKIQNTKAIYLGPYLDQFGANDDYHVAWKTIKDSKCPECQTTEKKNAEVTVEDFKNLSDYGLIVISSHGDTWFEGNIKSNMPGAQVITHTAQVVTIDLVKKYLADLLTAKIVIRPNNKLSVTPAFIRAYNGTFPKSLVYVSTCRSAYNGSMSVAYLTKGAKAYFGYNEYVFTVYAKKAGGTMMEEFIDKKQTAKESFDKAITVAGATDGDIASFVFWGHKNLMMGGDEIENGGFEEGLTGWQTEGDSRAISALASLKPQEGTKMAIISTGLGSVSDSNSSLIQKICINGGNAILTFKYNVVSEEPMEYVGSQFDDNFTMTVSINGAPATVVNKTINNSGWSPIGGINFAGGDATTFHTGWATATHDFGKLNQDDNVQVEFRVKDKGDSAYDTAALIDDVKLEIK